MSDSRSLVAATFHLPPAYRVVGSPTRTRFLCARTSSSSSSADGFYLGHKWQPPFSFTCPAPLLLPSLYKSYYRSIAEPVHIISFYSSCSQPPVREYQLCTLLWWLAKATPASSTATTATTATSSNSQRPAVRASTSPRVVSSPCRGPVLYEAMLSPFDDTGACTLVVAVLHHRTTASPSSVPWIPVLCRDADPKARPSVPSLQPKSCGHCSLLPARSPARRNREVEDDMYFIRLLLSRRYG
jgi:hypothetical protein